MGLRHIAVTQKQFDETWNSLPVEMRYWNEESLRSKAGIRCFQLGNLLLWADNLLPEDQIDDHVSNELIKLKGYKDGWIKQWAAFVLHPTNQALDAEIARLIEQNKNEGKPRVGYTAAGIANTDGHLIGWIITSEYACPVESR